MPSWREGGIPNLGKNLQVYLIIIKKLSLGNLIISTWCIFIVDIIRQGNLQIFLLTLVAQKNPARLFIFSL